MEKFKKLLTFTLIFTLALIAISGCTAQPAGSEPDSQISEAGNKEPVPFNHTVQYYKSSGTSNIKSDFEAKIIRSYTELVEFQNSDKEFGSDYIDDKYNDEFFKENAIILLCTKHESGSMRDVINKIYKENGKLVIDYTTLKPTEFTNDIRYWRILVLVKRADVEGVTEVVARQTNETAPSGKQFKPDSTEYLDISSDYQMTFAKLPSPPKCKKVYAKDEIDKILKIINNAKKESIPNTQENGWAIMINITTPEKTQQISLLDETLKIDGEYFKVDSSLKDELLKAYDELPVSEQPYS